MNAAPRAWGALATWLAPAIVVGCSGEQWVIAEEAGATSEAGGEDSVTLPPVESCPTGVDRAAERAAAFAEPSVSAPHVGRWSGTIDAPAAMAFPSAEVELRLDAAGRGTLRFVAPEPPPARFDEAYLCDGATSGGLCGTVSGFVGGFEYPVEGARSRGMGLSFVIVDADPWHEWCALQTPIPRDDASEPCGRSFDAVPPGTERWSPMGCFRDTPAGTESIDCSLMYALEHCDCAADVCHADFHEGIEVGWSLSEDQAELFGSIWFENGLDAGTLRLTRRAEGS